MSDRPDLFDDEANQCPYAAYEIYRASDVPMREPRYENLVLNRFSDMDFLRQHEIVSAAFGVDPTGPFPEGTYKDIERTEPPRHSALKAYLFKYFSPSQVASWREPIEDIFAEHFDAVSHASTVNADFDVVEDICYPGPAAVMCQIMGFARDRRSDFQRWSYSLVGRLGHHISEKQRADLKEMASFVGEMAQRCRAAPGDDLLSYLTQAKIDGVPLSDQEIIANGVFFLAAGHETTTNFLSNLTFILAQDAALYAQLRDDRGLIPNALLEALRIESPVQNICRTAIDHCAFRGADIMADERVMFSLGGANHDPTQFAEPEKFRLDRDNGNRHLAFGLGHHQCLGARLALLEGEIYLNMLLDRFKSLRVTRPPERMPGNVMRGFKHLWLEGEI
jgi:cytochrome P450